MPCASSCDFCVVFGVVIAVGQAESALIGVGDLLVRIAEVLHGTEAEEDAAVGHGRGDVGEFSFRIEVRDPVELWLQRLRALGVDAFSSMQEA